MEVESVNEESISQNYSIDQSQDTETETESEFIDKTKQDELKVQEEEEKQSDERVKMEIMTETNQEKRKPEQKQSHTNGMTSQGGTPVKKIKGDKPSSLKTKKVTFQDKTSLTTSKKRPKRTIKRVGESVSVKKVIKKPKERRLKVTQDEGENVKIVNRQQPQKKPRKEKRVVEKVPIQEINDKDITFSSSSLKRLIERALHTGEAQVQRGVIELSKTIILDHLDNILQRVVISSERRPNSSTIRIEDVNLAMGLPCGIEGERVSSQEKKKEVRKRKSTGSDEKKKRSASKKHALEKSKQAPNEAMED